MARTSGKTKQEKPKSSPNQAHLNQVIRDISKKFGDKWDLELVTDIVVGGDSSKVLRMDMAVTIHGRENSPGRKVRVVASSLMSDVSGIALKRVSDSVAAACSNALGISQKPPDAASLVPAREENRLSDTVSSRPDTLMSSVSCISEQVIPPNSKVTNTEDDGSSTPQWIKVIENYIGALEAVIANKLSPKTAPAKLWSSSMRFQEDMSQLFSVNIFTTDLLVKLGVLLGSKARVLTWDPPVTAFVSEFIRDFMSYILHSPNHSRVYEHSDNLEPVIRRAALLVGSMAQAKQPGWVPSGEMLEEANQIFGESLFNRLLELEKE